MEEFQKVESLAKHIKEYLNTKISIIKLEIAERLSKLIAWLIAFVVVFFIMLFFVIFFSLAAAYWIGSALDKPFLGFLIVGGFYLLIALLVWWKRERLLRVPLMNALVRQLFAEEKNDDEKD